MNSLSAAKRLLMLLFVSLIALTPFAHAQASHVVISQVYGAGGNSGATYRYDYVELYNPTSAAVDLSTWSLQYASSTGPASGGAYAVLPLTGSVGAGQYFLARLCIGTTGSTNGVELPTPDFSATNYTNSSTCTAPALAAGAGKVALVNNQTALAGPFGTTAGLGGATCPTVNTAAIVDYVGYGTASTCYEGTGTTPTLAATTAAIRDAANDDSNDNKADFSAVTPNPRNSATNGSSATTLAVTSATANPGSVTAGNSTTLSVTVKPGSNTVTSTVRADLSTLGGSATQAFAASGTANVYTYTASVGGAVTTGSYSLPVTVTDQTNATANATITLTVQAAVVVTPIATIQANRAAYVGTNISTTGVVTLLQTAGFYMQTPSSTPGSTGVSEGLYVYTGTGKIPSTAAVGNNINVTGALTVYPAANTSHLPSLELTSPAITVNSTGQALPAPIAITSLTATGGIYQLTKYESMRVSVASLTATSGTDGTLTEATETIVSSGQFYAVLTGTPRPFREPGMDFRDYPTATCPSVSNCTATATSAGVARPANVVLFDDNPERIIVESSLGGGTALDVSTGAVIKNVTGVIDFTYSTDVPYGDPARLILTPGTVTAANYTPGISVTPLTVPGANQFTVAAFNIERFFNTDSTDNKYYNAATGNVGNSSAVNVTADAYARRLKKVSLAIRTVLNNPDIISLEEVENLSVAQDIAKQIDADSTGTKPGYIAYSTDSKTTYTNDVGGISIGFLVKPATVNVTAFEQMGNTTTFTASTGVQTLNDRPSDVLHATINRGTGITPYPITVISNHLRSLSGIGTSADTRLKKELQAEMLATLIQNYQTKGEHVIAVGDMNAFQFSDGYTDTLGTITGNVSPAGTSAQAGKAIVSPAAVDLITTLPANLQQTYVEYGNAQILDHAVVTADIAATSTLQVAHLDSDFPEILVNDATTPARISDHDVPVTYLALPAPVQRGTLTGTGTFPTTSIAVSSVGQVFTLANTGEAPFTITTIATTGDFSQSNNCGTSLAVGGTCAVNVVFKPTVAGARTGTLTVTGSATVAAVTLTGTAVTPDFTFTDTNNSTSTATTVAAGGTATVALKLTSLNAFAGSVTLTCVPPTGAPLGTTCSVATSPVVLAAAGSGTATLTILTTARTQTAGLGGSLLSADHRSAMLTLIALLLLAVALVRRTGRRAIAGSLLAVLFAVLAIGLTGCSNSASSTTSNPLGTPAGTYTYAVTAISGTLTHTETVTLTVQ